jgi:RNA polymerase sigma-70 factor, ECF subfamily
LRLIAHYGFGAMVQKLFSIGGVGGAPRRVEPLGAGDTELVRRCVAGDPLALRELFERERYRVHALLFRMIGSNAPLDDLAQEAFLEIFRSLPGFRGESALRTWVDRCVVRVGYAYFRRKSRVPSLECLPDTAAASGPSAEERVLFREAARRLYAELDRLEPRQRLAFSLFAIEARPLREVAEIMEASVVTTKLRVWRARQALEKRAKHDTLLAEFLGGRAATEEVLP